MIALGIMLLTAVFIIFKKSGSFFKSMITSALGGIGALCTVSAASAFFPLGVGFNLYTLAFSALYSVPGVVFLLVGDAFLG